MKKKRDKIIIIAGDPNSINSEIIFKSWKKLNRLIKQKIFIIGNFDLLKKQFNKLNYTIKPIKVQNLNSSGKNNEIKIIDIPIKFKDPFNVSKGNVDQYILKSLNQGHSMAMKRDVAGLINCPINKKHFSTNNIGVTEFLAKKCKINDKSEVMMIKSKSLAVCPITTHLDIKDVPKNITYKKIICKIKTIQKSYIDLFKKTPKIGVLGLNPHNAELKSGSEEVKHIIPAISYFKKKGYKIKGPLVADTVFIKEYKNYDVLVGMYHDQILSPFKTIFKFNAINITLGLNYLRASPDHGVAIDIVKKNKANNLSLDECIKFIHKFR